MWDLDFISESDFRKHVQLSIQQYVAKLTSYDLKRFNSNIVDPIKCIFDKEVYKCTWEAVVKNEISRQRDKSNNNDIGYFHQRIFQYINGCTVPQTGWDVIFSPKESISLPDGDRVKTVFVEMKNKHNTMNSASSGKTYIRMQDQILSDDDCACFLVEAIAKRSQNITWSVSVDGVRRKHRRIRLVSIDEFYSIVTGQSDAFYKICMALPSAIEDAVNSSDVIGVPKDTVIEELHAVAESDNSSFMHAIFMLGFGSYYGFAKESNK
ncbi:MAG: Eco47II family restriction endonuclease [Oscillospiraceae bacterium]|jgi:hypothetical protein|nr:Eco47II family restriction endonuclease [Oscillospiraceae bacterium]